MKIELKESTPKTDIPALPVGTYPAVVSGIWDIGKQEVSFDGDKSLKNQLMLRVEINKKIEVEGDFNGKRYCLYAWINIPEYFGDKANIVKICNALLGKSMTKEDFKSFDTDTLIGKNFTCSTGHSGTGKAKITGYSPAMEGMSEIKPELEPSIPEWVQKIADKAVTVGAQPTESPSREEIAAGLVNDLGLPF